MKQFIVNIIFIFSALFSYSITAQNILELKKDNGADYTAKSMKTTGVPLASGTYSIGTSGNFTTISSAFNKLGSDGIAGAVTFELIDTFYQVPADYYLDGPITGAGPESRVIMQPAENKNVTIQSDGRAVLIFMNTSYFTIDGIGLSGNTTLTIHALVDNSSFSNGCIYFLDNSDHNIVQNITAITDDHNRNNQVIGFWINNAQAGTSPDGNLIYHNFIKNSGNFGVYISGKNEITEEGVIRATGNIIRENIIGSETDGGVTYGIFLQYADSTVVENNVIQYVRRNFKEDWVKEVSGVNCYWCDNSVIRGNIVHNVDNVSSYGSAGILLSGKENAHGNSNWVYNNMIYDIRNSSGQASGNASGIQMYLQNNPQIFYNSVYLSSSESSPSNSSALNITLQCKGVEAVNNIFVNTRTESTYVASAIYDYSDLNLSSDCNDLYSLQYQNNCLVRTGSSEYYDLTEWQKSKRDINSISEMPKFIPGASLHINEAEPTNLESHGVPIYGINTDFDGELRGNNFNTDIGADEFEGVTVGINDKNARLLKFKLEQNYPNPFNPTTTIKYSIPPGANCNSPVLLKIYNVLGKEAATLVDEEKPAGEYEVTWNAKDLASGVYFYKILTGNYSAVKKMILLK